VVNVKRTAVTVITLIPIVSANHAILLAQLVQETLSLNAQVAKTVGY